MMDMESVIPVDFEFDLHEAIKIFEQTHPEPRVFSDRLILSNLHQAERRLEMATTHLDELSIIKDRISEGIKLVECGEVAGDIDSWQSKQYEILTAER